FAALWLRSEGARTSRSVPPGPVRATRSAQPRRSRATVLTAPVVLSSSSSSFSYARGAPPPRGTDAAPHASARGGPQALSYARGAPPPRGTDAAPHASARGGPQALSYARGAPPPRGTDAAPHASARGGPQALLISKTRDM